MFVEYWANTTPPRVRGPRRLLVHASDDLITKQKVLGRRLGVLEWRDVPVHFREEIVLLTYESHYESWNGHNALTSIGPALAAITRLELGEASASGPVAFQDAPTIRLYERLVSQKRRSRHYSSSRLGLDFTRFSEFLWKSGEAEGQPQQE